MTRGKSLRIPLCFALVSLLAACGGGSGDSSNATLASVVQDLDLDPDGLTTVLTFSSAAPDLGPSGVESDGGQTAVDVTVAGALVTVLWDAPVNPEHRVRALESGVLGDFVDVSTTDAAAPTYTVQSADQVEGLGGDVIEVQFQGPRVDPDAVELGANWSLVLGSTVLPLSDAAFTFDVAQQLLTITTDETANVHASFGLRVNGLTSVASTPVANSTVVGVAAGDNQAPTLVSVVQRLGEDEFGRVVDFTFSEAMSPVFATKQSNYSVGFPVFAQSAEQTAPETLRVTFTQPVVPGLDTVLLIEVLDAHGNAFVGAAVPVAAGSTVANDFAVDPVLETLSGAANDRLIVVTSQALAPATAIDADNWVLEVDGNAVDLSGAVLQYSLLSKTLTIGLDGDHTNGLGFELTPAGVFDVDGQAFGESFSGLVDGETTAPGILAAIQNRMLDFDGETLDVRFSEAVDPTNAETTGNYVPSGTQNVLSASLLPDDETVRLVLSEPIVPGLHTIAVSGITDLAGNTLVAVAQQALTSTDVDAPTATAVSLRGEMGLDNDRVEVVFDDLMVEDEVQDPDNWTIESPVGNPLDPSLASIVYSADSNSAVLTFDGGDDISFQFGADFAVSFGAMRDLGGNEVTADVYPGDVDTESGTPTLESAWVRDAPNQNQVVLVFDEPMANFDDADAVYRLRDQNGFLLGMPVATPTRSSDGRSVTLTFGMVVTSTNHVDVLGVTDVAGNAFFPELMEPIENEDSQELDFDLAQSSVTTVSGESNDRFQILFERRPSTFGLTDPANYSLSGAGDTVSLAGAVFEFDGDAVLTVHLGEGVDLVNNAAYTIEFSGLTTAQGVPMSGSQSEVHPALGDNIAPVLPTGSVRVDAAGQGDSLLVDFDEAVDLDSSTDTGNYLLEGLAPILAERVGPRTTRLSFAVPVNIGDTLDADVEDLAGNLGQLSRLVTAADSSGPLVTGVEGSIAPGFGGDRVLVRFHKPVDPTVATTASNYAVSTGGQALDLTSASLTYNSIDNEVTIRLPAGQELLAGQSMQVTVDGIVDHAGFSLSPQAVVFGTVSGDAAEPTMVSAFANRRISDTGLVLDVLFSEDVAPLDAQDVANWTVSGGQSVLTATLLSARVLRLELATPFADGQTLTATLLTDAAGNTAQGEQIAPLP